MNSRLGVTALSVMAVLPGVPQSMGHPPSPPGYGGTSRSSALANRRRQAFGAQEASARQVGHGEKEYNSLM
jgi:hypothetical protein